MLAIPPVSCLQAPLSPPCRPFSSVSSSSPVVVYCHTATVIYGLSTSLSHSLSSSTTRPPASPVLLLPRASLAEGCIGLAVVRRMRAAVDILYLVILRSGAAWLALSGCGDWCSAYVATASSLK